MNLHHPPAPCEVPIAAIAAGCASHASSTVSVAVPALPSQPMPIGEPTPPKTPLRSIALVAFAAGIITVPLVALALR